MGSEATPSQITKVGLGYLGLGRILHIVKQGESISFVVTYFVAGTVSFIIKLEYNFSNLSIACCNYEFF